eukprot:7386955-Prymnesium_polylepis.4
MGAVEGGVGIGLEDPPVFSDRADIPHAPSPSSCACVLRRGAVVSIDTASLLREWRRFHEKLTRDSKS